MLEQERISELSDNSPKTQNFMDNAFKNMSAVRDLIQKDETKNKQ